MDEARFLAGPSSPGAESGEEGGEFDAELGGDGGVEEGREPAAAGEIII